MKKIILLLFFILFFIAILGCENKKTVVTEQEEKDYYSCGDWKLYLTLMDHPVEYTYAFKLVSNSIEYTGIAYTNAPIWNDENPIHEEKTLFFDDLKCYQLANKICLAEVLDYNIWFSDEFSKRLTQSVEEIFKSTNKKTDLYVDFDYIYNENHDNYILRFNICSYNKELCESTYKDIILKLRNLVISLQTEYSCYIDPNLPILTENLLEKESEYKENHLAITLNDTNMTFTYQGILENN